MKEYEVTDDVIYSTFTYSECTTTFCHVFNSKCAACKDRVPHSVIRVLSEVRV